MTKRSGNFRLTRALWMAGVVVAVVGLMATYALSQQEKRDEMPYYPSPPMATGTLGGVNPTFEDLVALQKRVPFLQDYILHARDGKLTRLPAEKTRLPETMKADMVERRLAIAPDGTIYFNGNTTICKSTDQGRTWTAYPRGTGPAGEEMSGYLEILSDGTFLCISRTNDGENTDPIPVYTSSDKGRSWQMLSEIVIPAKYNLR